MSWAIQDRFPTWGENGEYPANGFFYEGGDQVNEKHQDALWNGIKNFEQNVRDSLTDIDSNQDGTVDAAEDVETNGTSSKIIDTTNNIDLLRANENGPIEIPNTDLQLATGQSIDDGSGVERLSIDNSSLTRLRDGEGKDVISAHATVATEINSYSDANIEFKDNEGGFIGVTYTTDSTAGVLRTPNAGFVVQGDGQPSSGSGLGMTYTSGNDGFIFNRPDFSTTSFGRLVVQGQPLELSGQGGLVDMSGEPADFRIATGQVIEDESGNERFKLASSQTSISDDTGKRAIDFASGFGQVYKAYSGQPIIIEDNEGGFNAIRYVTDSFKGALELKSAELFMSSISHQIRWPDQGGGSVPYFNCTPDGELEARDDDGNVTTLT
jgi:hypothetical protein